MDTESLRTFLAIHRAGGFTRASRALHRSQPALSRRIALLEHEVGAPLFERAAGGAALSQAGRLLLPHAERALAALEDCVTALRALRGGEAGPLRIAAVGTLASTDLTEVLGRFRKTHPRIEVSLRTGTSLEVSELVRRGEAVLGLRYLRDPSPEVECHALAPERLIVCCARGHALAGRSIASLTALADEPWLAFPSARESREATAGNLFAHFLARGIASVRWTPVDSLTAQKRLVGAGFGLALLPESSVREERASGALATIRVRDLRAENAVFAVVRRGAYTGAAVRELLERLTAKPLRVAHVQGRRRTRRSRGRS